MIKIRIAFTLSNEIRARPYREHCHKTQKRSYLYYVSVVFNILVLYLGNVNISNRATITIDVGATFNMPTPFVAAAAASVAFLLDSTFTC